jgi:hypothetical protein
MSKCKPAAANIGNPARHNTIGRRAGYRGSSNRVSDQVESLMFSSLNHHVRLIPTLIERKQKGEAIIKENDLKVLSLLSCLLVYHS